MVEEQLDKEQDVQVCSICGRSLPRKEVVRGAAVREPVAELIRQDHPEWSPDGLICHADLNRYRSQYVRRMVESEEGEMVHLEKEVRSSLRQQEVAAPSVDEESEEDWTLGQRLADRMADFVGTWMFLILFMIFVFAWMIMNSLVDRKSVV
jgi:hypothetical protein